MRYRNRLETTPRIPLLRWNRLWNPERWLELTFMAAFLLIALVFHYCTNTSITAKDFYATLFGIYFISLGGLLLFLRGEYSRLSWSIWGPLLVYLAYGTARTFGSPFPDRAWESWRTTLGFMAPILPAYLLAQNKDSAHRVLWVSTVVVWIVCIYGLFQSLAENMDSFLGWGGNLDPVHWPWNGAPVLGSLLAFLETDLKYFEWQDFPAGGPLRRICSTFGNPTFLAGFLVLLPTLYLAMAIRRRTLGKRLWPVLLTLVTIFLVMAATISKGAVLGTMGGVAVFLFFVGWSTDVRITPWIKNSSRCLGPILLVTTITSVISALFLMANTEEDVRHSLKSIQTRTITYQTTWSLVRHNWLFGVTPGNFAVFFPDYLEGELAEEYGWTESPEEKVMEHTHCEMLEIWADLGVVGLGFFLVFMVTSLVWVWRAWRASLGSSDGWILAGMGSGVAAAFCENLTSVSLRWTPSAWAFWAFWGACLGLAAKILTDSGSLPAARQWMTTSLRGVWLQVPAVLLTILLFIPASQRFTADWYFTVGRSLLSGQQNGAEKALVRSVKLNPAQAATHYLLGGHYFQSENYKKAVEHFQKVRDIRGDVVVIVENLATSYFKIATESPSEAERQEALLKAIELYEGSLSRHPTFARLQDYLARCYQRIGLERLSRDHRLQAIDLYEKWFRWPKSYPRPDYALDLGKNYMVEKEYEKAYAIFMKAYQWDLESSRLNPTLDQLFEAVPSMRQRWETSVKEWEASKTKKLF